MVEIEKINCEFLVVTPHLHFIFSNILFNLKFADKCWSTLFIFKIIYFSSSKYSVFNYLFIFIFLIYFDKIKNDNFFLPIISSIEYFDKSKTH